MEATLRYNPRIEASEMDCAAAEPMVVCVLQGRSGAVARYTLPARLLELMRLFDGERTLGEIFDAYDRDRPGEYRREALEALVRDFLVPKGLLIAGDADAETVEPRPAPGRSAYLHVKVPLLSGRVVRPVAAALGGLFHPVVAIVATAAALVGHVYFYGWIAPAAGLAIDAVSGMDVLLIAVLLNLGALIHEFGHASAAVRYGCSGTQIGWGIYIYFTVLYADVSEAWKLPRLQRAVVDVGGIYFQALLLLVMLAWHAVTGSHVPLYVFLLTNLSMAGTLNPFLRMDGYWLMSDLLGIVNLREQSGRLVKYGVARLFAGRDAQLPVWSLDRKTTIALGVYTALSVLFFGFMVVLMFSWVGVGLVQSFLGRVDTLWALARGGAGAVALISATIEVLWRGMVLFSLAFFVVRFVKGGLQWGKRLRVLLTRRDRPDGGRRVGEPAQS